MADNEQMYPVAFFGFDIIGKKTMLMQMWVDQWGKTEWRPVPLLKLDPNKTRSDSIAGYVPDDDDHENT